MRDETKPKRRKFFAVVLPILVLLVGVGVAVLLYLTREEPAQEEREVTGALVEAQRVERREHELTVNIRGTVEARNRVSLRPEVSGKLVYVHPRLVPGGIVHEGEVLARVDPRQYEQNLREARATLEQAEAQLELEKGRQEVAEADWEYYQQQTDKEAQDSAPALALRLPQLRSAEAQVQSARSRVERAELNLQYATVKAPFDAVVLSEDADPGQYANPQAPVATLVGIDAFWVRASMPVRQLGYIDIPQVNAERGSPARIRQEAGEAEIVREGHVVRVFPDLGQSGRMAQLLIEIPDPLGLKTAQDQGKSRVNLPLLLNAYVEADVGSHVRRPLIEIPRTALRQGKEVFVFADGQLEIRKLDIVWELPDSVLVDEGMEEGDMVVTSPLPSPLDGMKLRLARNQEEQASEAVSGGSAEKRNP